MNELKTYFELEAGGVVTKKEDGELKFLTIYRVKLDDYTLPKGHVEDQESLEEASIREVLEETAYPVETKEFVDSFEYKVKEKKYGREAYIIRRVYYFECNVVGKNLGTENPDETEGKTIGKWMNYGDAVKSLSYDTDKKLLKIIKDRFKQSVDPN